MHEEPLNRFHKPLLEPIWKALREKYQLLFSEYSFTNNYLFRHFHSFKVVLQNPPIVIGQFNNGQRYCIPTLPPEMLATQAIDLMRKFNCLLYPIPDEWLSLFPTIKFEHEFDLGDSDYLFKKEKIATLSGRHLSSRRNLLHQLEKHDHIHSKPIEANLIPDLFLVLDDWAMNVSENIDKDDYWPSFDELIHFHSLNMFGRVVYQDNEPVGFTIGLPILSSVVAINTLKYRKQIKGIVPFLYKDFAAHLDPSIEWINFQQDLGKPSLRQAKKAYDPDQIKTKWRIGLKKS